MTFNMSFKVLLLFSFLFGIVLTEALFALDHLIQPIFKFMLKDLSFAQFLQVLY